MSFTSETTPALPPLARSSIYRALTWSMLYPTAEHVAAWTGASVQEAMGLRYLDTSELAAAAVGDAAEVLLRLRIEYTRLFVNAVPHVLAAPYASAYSHDGFMMGKPAEAVLEAYRQAGLAFSGAGSALPDHVAAELEFMSYLAGQEQGRAGNHEQAALMRAYQLRFLQDHLLTWLPAWRVRVAEHDRTGFYAILAGLIERWLLADAASLEIASSFEETAI